MKCGPNNPILFLQGLLMAIFLDNSGGAWDNSKKLIESQNKKGTEANSRFWFFDSIFMLRFTKLLSRAIQ